MEVTSPAQLAPSLTRYRIHRFTSGYFYDEYEPLSVVCCCFFSVDRQFQLLCGFAHCRISAVLRWPALRVCHFPAGTQWLATVLNHCTFKIGHMCGACCLRRSSPSLACAANAALLRLYRHLNGAWKGGLKGLIWGPGCHGFWPLGDHGRVPEHEGLGILNTSPQASFDP